MVGAHHAGMDIRRAIRSVWAGVRRAAAHVSSVATAPFRRRATRDPLTLSTVFRGVQILQTAIGGLPVRQMRDGVEVRQDLIIARPDPNCWRATFIAETVMALALNGNAFWLKLKDMDGHVVGLRNLPPELVTISDVRGDPANPDRRFGYMGREYTDADVIHLPFMKVPGRLRGIGPIQACREEIEGALDAKDYRSRYFTEGSHPTGIISYPKNLTKDAATQLKNDFKANVDDIKVLPQDLKYTQLTLNPKDAQFLETQQFDTTQIARLLGIPASLMMSAVEGSNLTYSNIEQEWIQFADFTLEAYAQPIELALGEVIPRGNEVMLDWDSMRRSDTKTKAETYEILIRCGVLTVNEARAKEGMDPLPEPSGQTESEDSDGQA